jgi:hypothetical protein
LQWGKIAQGKFAPLQFAIFVLNLVVRQA